MAEKVTVELSEERQAGSEPVLEALSDAELLTVCGRQLDASIQEELDDLLERNQEGALDDREGRRLDDLMRTYRAGLVRKAQALKIAVDRGLRPRLS
jgi:hypothetical protein